MNVKFVCWSLLNRRLKPRPVRLLKALGLRRSGARQEVVRIAAATEGSQDGKSVGAEARSFN
jgi:hypothetical protein